MPILKDKCVKSSEVMILNPARASVRDDNRTKAQIDWLLDNNIFASSVPYQRDPHSMAQAEIPVETSHMIWWFLNDSDAAAFKLRWGGQ